MSNETDFFVIFFHREVIKEFFLSNKTESLCVCVCVFAKLIM